MKHGGTVSGMHLVLVVGKTLRLASPPRAALVSRLGRWSARRTYKHEGVAWRDRHGSLEDVGNDRRAKPE
eukprot:scaffold213044_cov31-Tisochrysis_lutea.AAC.1